MADQPSPVAMSATRPPSLRVAWISGTEGNHSLLDVRKRCLAPHSKFRGAHVFAGCGREEMAGSIRKG